MPQSVSHREISENALNICEQVAEIERASTEKREDAQDHWIECTNLKIRRNIFGSERWTEMCEVFLGADKVHMKIWYLSVHFLNEWKNTHLIWFFLLVDFHDVPITGTPNWQLSECGYQRLLKVHMHLDGWLNEESRFYAQSSTADGIHRRFDECNCSLLG